MKSRLFMHGPKLPSYRPVFFIRIFYVPAANSIACSQLLPCHIAQTDTMHICKAAVASSPQLSAVPPNSTGKKNQENHHNSHKKNNQFWNLSFLHPFLNITRMKDSEKTHLKYSSSTKSCNNMKKIKLRCSEWCTLHYIFSVFTFAHMQVSFEAVILLECSHPTNHSTARAKITIYSCMQHLLVWIMSIRN